MMNCESCPGHILPNASCATHIKTGKMYYILAEATDCTNARDGNRVVVYTNAERTHLFTRDLEEFNLKFRRF